MVGNHVSLIYICKNILARYLSEDHAERYAISHLQQLLTFVVINRYPNEIIRWARHCRNSFYLAFMPSPFLILSS